MEESVEAYQKVYAKFAPIWEMLEHSLQTSMIGVSGEVSESNVQDESESKIDASGKVTEQNVQDESDSKTGAGGISGRNRDDPSTPTSEIDASREDTKQKVQEESTSEYTTIWESEQKTSMSRLLNLSAKVKEDIKIFPDNGELMKYCRELENWHKKGKDSISAEEYDREYERLKDMWEKFVLNQPNQTRAGGIPERDGDDPNTQKPKIKATKKVTEQSIQGELEPGAAVLKEGEVRRTDPYFMPDSDSTDTSKKKKELLEEDRKYVIEYEIKFFEKKVRHLTRTDKIKIRKVFEDVKQWLNINHDRLIKKKREAKIQELEEYCDSFFTSQTTSF